MFNLFIIQIGENKTASTKQKSAEKKSQPKSKMKLVCLGHVCEYNLKKNFGKLKKCKQSKNIYANQTVSSYSH